MKRLKTLLVLPLLVLLSCGPERDPLTEQEARLIDVYAELLILSEQLRTTPLEIDSAQYRLIVRDLLERNSLTQEEFRRQVEDLLEDDERTRAFFEKLHLALGQRRSPS